MKRLLSPRVVLTILLFGTALNGCKREVLGNLGERDAQRISAYLQRSGIAGDTQRQADGRWVIRVAEAETAATLTLLESAHLLPEEEQDTANEISALAGREEVRFHLTRKLSRMLEQTMRSIEGVLAARVHIVAPVREALGRSHEQSAAGSASVLIVVDPTFAIESQQIVNLIAGASGVAPGAVQVIVQRVVGPAAERQFIARAPPPSLDATIHTLSAIPALRWFVLGTLALLSGVLLRRIATFLHLRLRRLNTRRGDKREDRQEEYDHGARRAV